MKVWPPVAKGQPASFFTLAPCIVITAYDDGDGDIVMMMWGMNTTTIPVVIGDLGLV